MQIKNIQIFSTVNAADGTWVDVSNLVNLSVMLTGVEANVWIEVSDDPNAPIDGAGVGAPSAGPTLNQANAGATFQSGVSFLPAQTYSVKQTFVTKWGETTASAATSLAVTAGNYLIVFPTPPTAAQAPYVTGYNVYVSLTGGAGTWVLQSTPQFQPQRLIDGIGSTSPSPSGGTIVETTQSTRFAISGAIQLGKSFTLINGFQQTQWVPPAADQSGSASVGVNISGNLPGAPATGSQVQITGATTTWMFNPSGLCWKWLRVRKDTVAGALTTVAYLCGQNG
jgi:hypothetical protein